VAGERGAIDRVQRSSARYFQRPDADYLRYDSLRTALSGFTASVRADKNAGRHTLWGIQVALKSPGFEVNDIGQMARADAIDFNADLQLRDTKPNRVVRYFQIGHSIVGQSDFGLERQFLRLGHTSLFTFHNFWNLFLRATYTTRAMSGTQTRGGPYMATQRQWSFAAALEGNPSGRATWNASATLQDDEIGGSGYGLGIGITARPAPPWEASLTPRYSRSTSPRQYIATLGGGSPATYGRRYLFAFIEQSTLSAQLRLNYAFTPNLTVQGYAEPFASSGRFRDFGELARARSFDLRVYGRATGTTITALGEGRYLATDGAASVSFESPDFRVLSFRSNLVLRWEWLAGSTLFVIWQQNRGALLSSGDRVGPGELWDATTAPGDNFFALKLSYWLKAR
jgi:hypothetical protein